MIDPLDVRVALLGHVVEAAQLGEACEGGAKLAEPVGGHLGSHVLVLSEDGEPVDVLDGHDRPGEIPAGPGGGGQLLGTHRALVDVAAGNPVDRGEQVTRDALRDEVVVVGGGRVHRHGAAVGAHRHPRHRFDAAGDHQLVEPRTDRLGGQVDRLEAGAAEAVQLHAGDRVGHPGSGGGGAGDVHALVPHRRHAAEDHVGDPLLVQIGEPAPKLVDQADDQIDRLHAVQCAAALARATGGADGLENEGIGDGGGHGPTVRAGARSRYDRTGRVT
ncbi:MAG TPA: hypothetical protein PKD89_12370 [Candidatus Microthrix sp.]|nr:hypothetical protein [Candidatus Microthrix sp.]HMS48371.1 hypothetical protein [Candidatus Microthrix sp.]